MNYTHTTANKFLPLLLLGGIAGIAGWALYLADAFTDTAKTPTGNNPIAVYVSSPANGEAPATLQSTAPTRARRAGTPTSIGADRPAGLPAATMSGSEGIFAHRSTAAVSHQQPAVNHQNGSYTMTMHSTAEDAKRGANLSYGGNMLALSSSMALSAPGASHATDLSGLAASPAAAPAKNAPRRTPPDPLDPFLNPIGEVVCPLMALLAAYVITIVCRAKARRQDR